MTPAAQPDGIYDPAGRLVPILGASDGVDAAGLALRLGRFAASMGETVLIIDDRGGEVMSRAGVVWARSLGQAVAGECALRDCLYITSNEHFTMTALGGLELGDAVGTLAALSLEFDWVFAVPPAGLSPSAARLAAGSDACVLGYDTEAELYMRAYWIIDAIRARNTNFDPHTLSCGDQRRAVETAMTLDTTVREHLGGAPAYAGHDSDRDRVKTLLESMRKACRRKAA